MFPADSLPAAYCEEQGAVYAARQRARQQALAQQQSTSCNNAWLSNTPSTASSQTVTPAASPAQGPCPQTLTNALLQQRQQQQTTTARQPGFFGNLFQGLKSGSSSGACTPASRGVTPIKEKTQAELLAEQKMRDADICAMPAW